MRYIVKLTVIVEADRISDVDDDALADALINVDGVVEVEAHGVEAQTQMRGRVAVPFRAGPSESFPSFSPRADACATVARGACVS